MSEQVLQNVLVKHKRSIRRRRAVLIIVGSLFVFTCIAYGALTLINQHMLTVSVVKPGIGGKEIALSESIDFSKPLSMLGTDDDIKLDHYTYSWLPFDLGEKDGDDSKAEGYLAYTFYLRNMSAESLDYNMKITLTNVTKNIDEAIRIMTIVNGVRTVYAKPAKSGAAEWITGPAEKDKENWGYSTPFLGGGLAADTMRNGLEAGETDKYTIVVWLEGDDPECLNAILDGKIKIDIKFTVKE